MERISPEHTKSIEVSQEDRLIESIDLPVLENPKEAWIIRREIGIKEVKIANMVGDLNIEIFRQTVQDSVSGVQYPLGLKFYFDTSEVNSIAYYNAALCMNADQLHWVIVTRKVEKQYRDQGIGSATLALMEGLMKRMSDIHDMHAQSMEMNTTLYSLASLAQKRGWKPKPGEEYQLSLVEKQGYEDAEGASSGSGTLHSVNLYKAMG